MGHLFPVPAINIKMPLAKDLLHPSVDEEKNKCKLKRLVQHPNSYFMDVKCPGLQDHHCLQPRTDCRTLCRLCHRPVSTHRWKGEANGRLLLQKEATLETLPFDRRRLIAFSSLPKYRKKRPIQSRISAHQCFMNNDVIGYPRSSYLLSTVFA